LTDLIEATGLPAQICSRKTGSMGSFAGIHSRTLLFINENEGWEKTISTQSAELPELEELLGDKEEAIASHPAEKAYFQEILSTLKEELRQLSGLLKEQQ